MSWTYDETALSEPRNLIRLKLGDTNKADPQLQDEEIDQFVKETDTVAGATLLAAKALAARYARYVDKWVGDLKILASQRHRAYLEIVKDLSSSGMLHGVPSAGGVFVGDKEAIEDNDSLVSPFFRRGMHDNRQNRG